MKKILGLDLGSASIGWALISEEDTSDNSRIKTAILGMGSRIVPYDGTEGKDFEKGTGESRNALRTRARTARKGYDRYQLRRKLLVDVLCNKGMMPGDRERQLDKMALWGLRSKAVTEKISLKELGRILLWLNQKRGYKSSRSEANLDKKDTEYVAEVKSRHMRLKDEGLTIGQYFYNQIKENQFFRVKENVFPREAYIEEFEAICSRQSEFHYSLSEELIRKLRNEIIYYQRPLKSQKGLVSVCEFEGFKVKKTIDGVLKEYFVGPKVAHRSCPLFEVARIWENINNLRISKASGEEIILTLEEKGRIYDHLDNNERLTKSDLLKILGLKKDDCHFNKQIEKGLSGNRTKSQIMRALGSGVDYSHLLRLELAVVEKDKLGYLYDRKTGEVLNEKTVRVVDSYVEKEPLYQLWHTIYSLNDQDECRRAIQRRFSVDEITAGKLAGIDFSSLAFGNKSVKAIRKILPYLMDGDSYSDAMSYAGFNHSQSLTKDEIVSREVRDFLEIIPKNTLRQPVVEKILNQMVNVVNAIIEKYGKPDEIRVELARELKQSKEERNRTEREINQREKENKEYAVRLAEYGLRATRTNLIKWRLYQEISNEDKKLNAICIYCGQPISLTEAIRGTEVDVEHIIPKSRLFDDSQSNKTLSHRRCNSQKGDRTAFDYMKSKSDYEFNSYLDRVNMLYSNNIISRSKRNKFLTSQDKIPNDFIDRQLRESQFISRKARELLFSVCRNVWCTSGKVTAELRHIWGWDDVLMNLQLPKYREQGLTEIVEQSKGRNGYTAAKEKIVDWSKRDDHRHHAIDALVIACTRQGFIQRFNTLNSAKTREDMFRSVEEMSGEQKDRLSLLEKYILSMKPLNTAEVEHAAAKVLISFKQGKRVAVTGTRRVGRPGRKRTAQKGILVPRGPLSEESVYGKIRTLEERKPLKYIFENPHLIFKTYIRELVEERLAQHNGDVRKSLASLRKEPIIINSASNTPLEYATCFGEEYVIRYKVDTNFTKTDKVIDRKVREILSRRLEKFGGKPREAFKDIKKEDGNVIKWYEDEGLERPVRTVRCYTGLSAVVPVRKDENGRETGFVKPGNNHHVAIYRDADGNRTEQVCTFWHAVERKKYGFPVIIKETDKVWDRVQELSEGSIPESFLGQLPQPGLVLELSMQQNEMFILGMSLEELNLFNSEYSSGLISDKLFRVQKLGSNDYWFRHHLETQIIDDENASRTARFLRLRSIGSLFSVNPIKVRVNYLGEITG